MRLEEKPVALWQDGALHQASAVTQVSCCYLSEIDELHVPGIRNISKSIWVKCLEIGLIIVELLYNSHIKIIVYICLFKWSQICSSIIKKTQTYPLKQCAHICIDAEMYTQQTNVISPTHFQTNILYNAIY